jgi:uridine kinase
MFLPLFLQVDRMQKQSENVTLAIEGGSASGKTTLSKLLEKVYSSTVLHMDDFFLRPQQRTPERFLQPGGNVDWERFLEEVLTPLKKRESVSYRRFDCRTFALEPPVMLTPTKLTVIEGAYSMHPQLEDYYDLSVFLDISSKHQETRIRKRNVPAMAERFFQEWIPMERHYFEATGAKERCDLVVEIK